MITSHEQPCINEAKLQKEDGYSLKYICVENNAWLFLDFFLMLTTFSFQYFLGLAFFNNNISTLFPLFLVFHIFHIFNPFLLFLVLSRLMHVYES